MKKNSYTYCMNEWALDKNIRNELGLLIIISGLCVSEGYCWASNKYLAELFNESEVSISRKIKKLVDNNYIKVEYKKNGTCITKREIRLTNLITAVNKTVNGTLNKNDKYINNNIINTSNNNMLNKFVSGNVIDLNQYYEL